MKIPKSIQNLSKAQSKVAKQLSIIDKIPRIPELVKDILEMQDKFKFNLTINLPLFEFPKIDIPKFESILNSEFYESIQRINKTVQKIENDPELQFAFITDLEILNHESALDLKETLIQNLKDEDIAAKEELLNENLLPLLSELKLDNLWIGAGVVLNSENNPDKLRHSLISLRTLLEYLIDDILAPKEELKKLDKFKKEFRNYHLKKETIEYVRIKRFKKIEYFVSKFKFGMLEEFTKKEINYVCDCYSILCNIHSLSIGITENQVRSLKVKTGITLWLLIYLYKIIERPKQIKKVK